MTFSKAQWEAAFPGRAHKSTLIREQYLTTQTSEVPVPQSASIIKSGAPPEVDPNSALEQYEAKKQAMLQFREQARAMAAALREDIECSIANTLAEIKASTSEYSEARKHYNTVKFPVVLPSPVSSEMEGKETPSKSKPPPPQRKKKAGKETPS